MSARRGESNINNIDRMGTGPPNAGITDINPQHRRDSGLSSPHDPHDRMAGGMDTTLRNMSEP